MAGKTYQYDENVYIKPGLNNEVLVWLLLLGLPALLLFMVFARQNDALEPARNAQPAPVMQQVQEVPPETETAY